MVETGGGNTLNEDCNTKKVRFKGLEANAGKDMAIDLPSVLALSWRDKVLGRGYSDSVYKEDLDFIERDITRSIVNGIHAIDFFERIQNILVRDMAIAVVVKLLGHNRIYSLWKPSHPFHLMNVKNGYFLVKFQIREDYEKVLT
ncbi:hypothetical protein PVK06_044533 [Gossypium arboreum]|uniref:Uncharacterized protein n=1 Tax=Gossypium arboreum TaxID=29729 RepID=A0ABR0MRI8_GOSAR|nr:hypothetical protein PVK06_044533 [Gossypium arboreum]